MLLVTVELKQTSVISEFDRHVLLPGRRSVVKHAEDTQDQLEEGKAERTHSTRQRRSTYCQLRLAA